jgi:hypothetical protein
MEAQERSHNNSDVMKMPRGVSEATSKRSDDEGNLGVGAGVGVSQKRLEQAAGCGDERVAEDRDRKPVPGEAPLLRRLYVFHDGENAYIPPTVTNGGGLFQDVVVSARVVSRGTSAVLGRDGYVSQAVVSLRCGRERAWWCCVCMSVLIVRR